MIVLCYHRSNACEYTMSAMALLFLEMTFTMDTIVHTHPNTAACPSVNINYPSIRTVLCPGDIITYTCAFNSGFNTIMTWWTGSGFQCPSLAMSLTASRCFTQCSTSIMWKPLCCDDQHQWNMLHLCPYHTSSSIFQWNHSHVQRWR